MFGTVRAARSPAGVGGAAKKAWGKKSNEALGRIERKRDGKTGEDGAALETLPVADQQDSVEDSRGATALIRSDPVRLLPKLVRPVPLT